MEEEEEGTTDDFVRFRSSLELDPPPSINVPNLLPDVPLSLSFPFPFEAPTVPEVMPRKKSLKPPPLDELVPPAPPVDVDSAGALVCLPRAKLVEDLLDEEAAAEGDMMGLLVEVLRA